MFMAMGNALALPLSLFADFVLHSERPPALGFVGTGVVFVSFLAYHFEEWYHNRRMAKGPVYLLEEPDYLDQSNDF